MIETTLITMIISLAYFVKDFIAEIQEEIIENNEWKHYKELWK